MSPRVVALARAIILAALSAAIGAAITAATAHDWGDLAPYAPIAIAVLRLLEGVVLDRQQEPQEGVLGGKAAEVRA